MIMYCGYIVYMWFSGGKLLDELKRLLKNFDDIEELKVNHLLLDLKDAPGVLEPIIYKCGKSISYLEIRNFTKVCCHLEMSNQSMRSSFVLSLKISLPCPVMVRF